MGNQQDAIRLNIELWKKNLLDISSRNQSINFRRRKSSTVQIIVPSFEECLEKLSSSRSLTFQELFDEDIDEDDLDDILEIGEEDDAPEMAFIQRTPLPKKDIYSPHELIPFITRFRDKFKASSLFTTYSNKILRNGLRNIVKKAKAFKDENAINVLYIAVGYLEWFESKDSNISHNAPLLFLPVEVTQESYDAPFQLSVIEGDLLINDALLRKMHQEFNLDLSSTGLNSDADLIEYYRAYKLLVQSKLSDQRWIIKDDLDLGIFSFSKINMVRDLEDNASKISNNSLLQKISGVLNEQLTGKLPDEETVEKLIQPEHYFHILEADSSQELAIQSAIQGHSFVLQGPPGTGKSQTITNIITELMARNKKILFVAEKKAALDVVYNNLKKIGLNDFALPIHNSKLDRKQVLLELNKTLEKGQNSINVDGHFSMLQITKYKDAKMMLTDYPEFLTKRRGALSKSIYDLYGLYFKYAKKQDLPFQFGDVHSVSPTDLFEIERTLNNFHDKLKAISFEPTQHVWYGLKESIMTSSVRETIMGFISDSLLKLDELEGKLSDLKDLVVDERQYINNLSQVMDLISHLLKIKNISKEMLFNKNLKTDIEYYQKIQLINADLDKIKSDVSLLCSDEIYDQFTSDKRNIVINHHSWMKRLFSSSYRQVVTSLKPFFLNGTADYPTIEKVVSLLTKWDKVSKIKEELIAHIHYREPIVDSSPLSDVIYDLKWVHTWNELNENEGFNISTNHWMWLRSGFVNPSKSTYRKLDDIVTTYHDLTDNLRQLQGYFDTNIFTFEALSKMALNKRLSSYISEKDSIYSYTEFNETLQRCLMLGLEDFAKRAITTRLKSDFYDVFLKRFYGLLIEKYLLESSTKFTSTDLDNARINFAQAESMIQNIAKTDVEKRIIQNIPNFNGIEGLNSEVTTLRIEANKVRKLLPFRVLFSKIPNLILKLKPCLMMSPLSVSTFLRDTSLEFDTVIFDEASQVKPENAIGALFRSKQYIITGDKEQLPPTNFFQYVDDEELPVDDVTDTAGYDSILDVASSHLHLVKLRWHYRSKFEELIHPSNQEIYHNLITFPSKTKPQAYEGVQFIHAGGIYADRRNEAEAEKVLSTLLDLIRVYNSSKSIGVVTFNTEQQSLIEGKINRFRHKNPEYEDFFSNNQLEPFFVKNIESVQGDERDIIIISVGYGPDGNGKMSMNFGPLNQSNGYRRLNVAVTRAKVCLMMIASFRSVDIDLNRTQSRGVVFLKHYLEFAEHGADDRVDTINEFASFDSPFEEEVYNELVGLGYEVKKQVGSSGYRIDLAVVDPERPGHYLVGIECDGATYHSSKSVRDRDRLRQQVLENRNWIIYRIWSTDWFKNKAYQVRKMKDYIANIKREPLAVPLAPVNIPIHFMPREAVHPTFATYPNYEIMTEYIYRLHPRSQYHQVFETISRTAPIHENELRRIVPTFWGRVKYTSVVEEGLSSVIWQLLTSNIIEKQDQFYLVKNGIVTFRECKEVDNRRDMMHIHHNEINDGIIQVMKIARSMDSESLYTTMANYCGYQSVTPVVRARLENSIQYLIKKKSIHLSGNIIILNSDVPTKR